MLTEEWGLAPPHLVVALVGGDELAQMKPWLRDTLRKGLVKAAQSTGSEAGGASKPTQPRLAHPVGGWRRCRENANGKGGERRRPLVSAVEQRVIYDALVSF